MNIGIITFTYGCNYGQRLQNYALQEVLHEYGDEVITIPQRHKDVLLKRYLKVARGIIKSPRKQLLEITRSCAFKQFDAKYIKYYRDKIDEKHIHQKMIDYFDYFVCGSDQIWSPFTTDVNDTMFLTFAPMKKRICYAPSIAADYIPSEKAEKYKEYWQGFNLLSLREEKLIDYIEKTTGKKASLVADPTLLIATSRWEKLEHKPEIIEFNSVNKYALFYFLGNGEKAKRIKDYLKKNNIHVIDLLNDDRFYVLGPSEFLYLVHHAELVVTDSYHGTIFSMIYHTPFVIFERKSTSANMNSRFETLYHLFGINNRLSDNVNISELFEMNFSDVDKSLNVIQQKSKKYLNECFSG